MSSRYGAGGGGAYCWAGVVIAFFLTKHLQRLAWSSMLFLALWRSGGGLYNRADVDMVFWFTTYPRRLTWFSMLFSALWNRGGGGLYGGADIVMAFRLTVYRTLDKSRSKPSIVYLPAWDVAQDLFGCSADPTQEARTRSLRPCGSHRVQH